MPVLWAFGPGLWSQRCYSAIFYLSIFVGFLNLVATDELVEKIEKIRCAGQSVDEDVCASDLCYDSIHIIHDIVDTGCAATSLCTAPGCFLDESRQEFICCCRYAYCNGKSHRMVKARWRMFQNGDYHQNIASRSPRLIPRNVKTPEVDAPLTTSQIQTKPETRPSSITTRISAIIQTTTPTESPSTKHSTKLSTIAAPKLEENRQLTNQKEAKPKPTQAPNRASPVSKKTQQTTTSKSVSAVASTAPPVVQINYVSPSTTTDLPEYTTAAEALTTKKSTTQKQSVNSKKIVQIEKLKPTSTTSFLNTTQSAKSTTEGSTMTTKLAETTTPTPTRQNSTTLLPKTTTTAKLDPHENKQQANTIAQTNYVETTQKTPTFNLAQSTFMPKVSQSSSKGSTEVLPDKRTTRSPINDQNDSVLPHTYPWYWVCLFGFVVSAVIFLVVFFCLRRCGYGRVRRRSSGELADSRQADEEFAISPREEPKKIINGKRKVKRSEKKILLKTKNIPNGITNESLASRCTAITTASGKTHDDDDDFTIGKELTVIDPLLNKSYSGTVHDPPGGNKITKY
ncbi:hypothetical protein Ddc_00869 [Ditylenchus destructor]|nr:hypothetical protein Ddc_00869 [Ditylenchus destructor]